MRRRGGSRWSDAGVALIALAVLVPLLYLGVTKSVPFQRHYEVKAVFESANNLRTASPVRVAGVEVGRVTKIERLEEGGEGVEITMRIGKAGRPIKEDARLKIRPRIFLEGNFFIDVEPGTPSAPELDDGGTIPVNQTATPVQLDQILTALQSDTREDLKTLLDQYSRALEQGGAKGFNRSIPHWAPAYRDTAIVNDAMLGRAEHDLSGYVEHAGTVMEALDRNSNQLKNLITDFNTTAAAFAREDGNLRAAIAELPRTLRAAQPALGALNDSFPPLRAFAADFRPGVRSSGPAIDDSMPLIEQLRGLVSEDELRGLTRDLRPAVPALARLSRQSVPLSRQARLMASCSNEVLIPFAHDKVEDKQFPAQGPVYQEAPKPFVGLAGESRSGDSNGQWFRVLAASGTNLVTFKPGVHAVTAFPILGVNPPKPQGRPPLRRDVACEAQETPDLRSMPGDPPPQRKIDTNDPEFKARYAKAREKMIDWAREQIKAEGLSDELKVVDEDATQAIIDKVAAAAGKAKP